MRKMNQMETDLVDALKLVLHWETNHRKPHRNPDLRCCCGNKESSEAIATRTLAKYKLIPMSERP